MLFTYEAIDAHGERVRGNIEAISEDVAIRSLQRRNLILSAISSAESKALLDKEIHIFDRVKTKDVVILSQQISTLFEAQVSALKVFRMLAGEVENKLLARTLVKIASDLQGGSSIYSALAKHPKIFSPIYVNMVRAGEESGQLDKTFRYLADYLDRTYALVSKARNAMVYPLFVILVFFAVMIFMFTSIVPSITAILTDSGQEIPFYTKIVIGISDALVNYGILLLAGVILGGFFLFRYLHSKEGSAVFDRFKLAVPYVGDLYTKLYLSRISDNMSTMLGSGISVVKSLEITGTVVGNKVYEGIIAESIDAIKSGTSVSSALGRYEEIPGIMTQMLAVGEESGEMGNILSTLARFYRREVENAVDTLVGLIEPAMIVLLGLGVLTLLVSVLVPIYNLSSTF